MHKTPNVCCVHNSFISFLLQNIVYLFNFIYIYLYLYLYNIYNIQKLLCHFQTLQILTTLVTIYRC